MTEQAIELPAPDGVLDGLPYYNPSTVLALARQAVLAERERCAKLCEAERVEEDTGAPEDRAYNWATKHCASAIRASAG
jgi:hypothetical protein